MRVSNMTTPELDAMHQLLGFRMDPIAKSDIPAIQAIIGELIDRRAAMKFDVNERKILLAQLAAPIAAATGASMRVRVGESVDDLQNAIVDGAVDAAEAILKRVGL